GFDERDLRAGERDPQGETGEAGAAADVDEPLAAAPSADGQGGERIEKVLPRDARRFGDRRKVHIRIAFDEQSGIPRAQVGLRGAQVHTDALGLAYERHERRIGGHQRHGRYRMRLVRPATVRTAAPTPAATAAPVTAAPTPEATTAATPSPSIASSATPTLAPAVAVASGRVAVASSAPDLSGDTGPGPVVIGGAVLAVAGLAGLGAFVLRRR